MKQPWSMARVASRRELPKPRKMMGPVGQQIDANINCMTDEEINRPTDKRIWFANGECSCCRECGYHVCSCEPRERIFEGNRTIWCTTCWIEHDVTPVGTPLPTCKHCRASGHWWTRSRKHPNGCPCTGCMNAGCIPSVSASTARSDDWIVPMGAASFPKNRAEIAKLMGVPSDDYATHVRMHDELRAAALAEHNRERR